MVSGVPQQRRDVWSSPGPPTTLRAQALADVAGYVGTRREETAGLWPDVVSGWTDYLRSGRYGDDVVEDLRVMDLLVQASITALRPPTPG